MTAMRHGRPPAVPAGSASGRAWITRGWRWHGGCDAGLVVDASIAVGLGLLAGGILPVCPGPTVVVVLASMLFFRRWLGRCTLVAALLALLGNAFRADRTIARFEVERASFAAALRAPARCAARGTVVTSPVLTGARSAALVPVFSAELVQLECEGRPIEGAVMARLYGGPAALARGDRIEVVADLAAVEPFCNTELSDPRPGGAHRGVVASGGAQDVRVLEQGRGIGALIDRSRAHARERIQATFPADAAPMARALVLGESDLDQADDRAFRASGLSHLLAVSGTHLVIVVAGAVSFLGAIGRRIESLSARFDLARWASAFGVALSWLYADFAGGSGSAHRAAGMLSFALGARALGRRPHPARAFGLSLATAAAADPLVGFDISFMLSAAATTGLMLLQRPMAARLGSGLARQMTEMAPRGPLGAVVTALATTLSASVGCAPLIAFLSPTLPVGGVFANLVAVPLGELCALPVCLAHALLAPLPALERGAAIIGAGSLLLVRQVARITEQADWLMLPVPRPSSWQCAILAATGLACLSAEPGRRVIRGIIGAAMWLGCEAALVRAGAPRDRLRVTVLDVGQGDSSLVDLPDGRAMLVDGGGLVGSPIDTGEVVVAPMLRARRRSALAAVVLSHPHPDHFGGLGAALERMRVGEFWDTGQGEREGAGAGYARLLALFRARRVPIVRPDSLCGAPRRVGGATIEVLAPCPAPLPFANANDNSFVLRISFGRRAALLVGDAEHGEEEALVARLPGSLRADFLKVGHHGSATSSSPEFLHAVGAADAAISCGARNRFGHPHERTLRTLEGLLRVHRTDRDGSIRWETDGVTTSIATAVGWGLSRPGQPWSILLGRHF